MPTQIYHEPIVSLISRQEIVYPAHLAWRSDTEIPAQAIAELAGRNCYQSYSEGTGLGGGHKTIQGRTTNEAYLANILRTQHFSVLEHAVWGILVEGVSRALSHELIRHRHLSVSQLSQRFVEESEVAFVRPPEIDPESPAFEIWRDGCAQALQSYRSLLAAMTGWVTARAVGETKTSLLKRSRQAARAVLPNATETKLVLTGNARAWRHFIDLRATEGADTEIRRLAVSLLRLLQGEAPSLFGDYHIRPYLNGEISVSAHAEIS